MIFERNLLAGFLVIMPLVVARYLFAFTGSAPNYWLWVDRQLPILQKRGASPVIPWRLPDLLEPDLAAGASDSC